MMDYLTIVEYAELSGYSLRKCQRLCNAGKVECIQKPNPTNGHFYYMIPISALPENLQAKYYKQKKTESGILPDKVAPENVSENALKTPINTV